MYGKQSQGLRTSDSSDVDSISIRIVINSGDLRHHLPDLAEPDNDYRLFLDDRCRNNRCNRRRSVRSDRLLSYSEKHESEISWSTSRSRKRRRLAAFPWQLL